MEIPNVIERRNPFHHCPVKCLCGKAEARLNFSGSHKWVIWLFQNQIPSSHSEDDVIFALMSSPIFYISVLVALPLLWLPEACPALGCCTPHFPEANQRDNKSPIGLCTPGALHRLVHPANKIEALCISQNGIFLSHGKQRVEKAS